MIHIGARVKVIDQDITGTVVRYDTGNKLVVLDDDRDMWRFDIEPEGEEGVLIYRDSELEIIDESWASTIIRTGKWSNPNTLFGQRNKDELEEINGN